MRIIRRLIRDIKERGRDFDHVVDQYFRLGAPHAHGLRGAVQAVRGHHRAPRRATTTSPSTCWSTPSAPAWPSSAAPNSSWPGQPGRQRPLAKRAGVTSAVPIWIGSRISHINQRPTQELTSYEAPLGLIVGVPSRPSWPVSSVINSHGKGKTAADSAENLSRIKSSTSSASRWIRANPDDKAYRDEVAHVLPVVLQGGQRPPQPLRWQQEFDDYLAELDTRSEGGLSDSRSMNGRRLLRIGKSDLRPVPPGLRTTRSGHGDGQGHALRRRTAT